MGAILSRICPHSHGKLFDTCCIKCFCSNNRTQEIPYRVGLHLTMWSARKIFLQVRRPILVGLTTSVVLYEDDCPVRTTSISRTSCSALSFLWGGETSPGGTRQKSTLRRQSTVELLQLTASSKTVDTVYNVKWQMPIGSGMFGDVYQGFRSLLVAFGRFWSFFLYSRPSHSSNSTATEH